MWVGVVSGFVSTIVGLDCSFGRWTTVLFCNRELEILVVSCLESPGVDLLVCSAAGRDGLSPKAGSDSPSKPAVLLRCSSEEVLRCGSSLPSATAGLELAGDPRPCQDSWLGNGSVIAAHLWRRGRRRIS